MKKISINSNNLNENIIQTNNKIGTGSKKTISAKGLKQVSSLDAQIAYRKKRAQKQAFKIIGDAWEKDKKADERFAKKITKRESNQQDEISQLKIPFVPAALKSRYLRVSSSDESVIFCIAAQSCCFAISRSLL